jgi:two-component system chemotaxis response regulator CheB
MKAPGAMVRVLVVEDSPSSRELLVGIFNADPQLEVVAVAADGEAAVAAAARVQPDVITMDIHLPVLDGFGATRRIMETCPTRIVMVTSSSIPNDVEASFDALACGALSVLAKPPGPGHPDFAALREELVRTVKLMAEVPVVRRWPLVAAGAPVPASLPRDITHDVALQLVAIGASTGGPLVLQAILSRLRPDFATPIVIVQHISLGFAEGFVQWLAHSTGYHVRVAVHGERLQPATAYVAPDGAQLKLRAVGYIELADEPHENGFRPSVAALFRSVARHYGRHAAGVLLTGMGQDGAKELKAMRQAGALTLVQDSSSAVIYGMPGEAVRLGAAAHVLPPETIAATLNRLVP